MTPLRVFAPAKINLSLAITGRRADGFHELVSLVSPLDWGDTLILEPRSAESGDTLECNHPEVPVDATNLVLRAAAAFRQRPGTGAPPVHFTLHKQVPAGAGLGGGSSDAAAALRGLNQLAAHPLPPAELRACAAETGSDVPLFLEDGPVIMRGRGEQVEVLGAAARGALRGQSILIFKPPFGISTAWAYRRLKEGAPAWYLSAATAEQQLADWSKAPRWATVPLGNNLELPVFEKYTALPLLLQMLRDRFGVRCQMSGSGSACFALLESDSDPTPMVEFIRQAWGPEAIIHATRLFAG